ncbi:PIR Superfamily Protein [Plasmodium ovale wallikeri]|uniref:PIR Superfamily Protein n=1 Tax=Plasmodium ovale wallikeri TaxID=864142 RepID=A0A1A9AKA6_PLAOA|nr:PIR Superfamily Protein [Plasmodium ovale wallikeri]SBT56934.1 PIR Superfamily Protein [Plasmodium ovale wallikeri]
MSETTNTCSLDKLAEEDNEFTKTVLFNLYSKFGNACIYNKDSYDHCSVDNKYDTVDFQVKLFFPQVLSNLIRIGTNQNAYFPDITYEKRKVCTYLKHWFYDQITYKHFKEDQINKIFQILEEEKQKYVNANCEFNKMNLGEIKIIKTLYDYFAFYETYSGNHEEISDKISNSKYCKNIKHANYYYTQFDRICDQPGSKSYCNEYKKYIKEFITFGEKSSISCIGEVKDFEQPNQDDYELLEFKQLIGGDDPLGKPQFKEVADDSMDSPDAKGNIIPATVSVSSVSIFSILFLLYKFTPFRSTLYRPIEVVKNVWKKKEENDEIVLQENEYEQLNSDYTGYNIVYNTLPNQ